MSEKKSYGFATRQIHAGREKNSAGALVTPIYQTSTFIFDTVQQGGNRFAGTEEGYIYSRLANPSTMQVEKKIADLEGAEAAIATASGMGAISACLWTLLRAGDVILAADTLYGCTFSLIAHDLPAIGFKTRFADFSDPEQIRANLNENTKIVYFETPCNPNMKLIDIEAVCRQVHAYNSDIKVVVDNTFSSPYLQTPIALGADIVVHSATKYINGHCDVIAGFIVGTREFIEAVRGYGLKDMSGAVMSPFDAFLIARGLKTLDIRMERHCDNAEKLARFFEGHPAVKKVYYPGLESFEGHEIAEKQMRRPGGMLSIDLYADRESVANALNRLEIATIAVSLGGPETLVEHAASMTHSTYTAEELAAAGISEGLVRISIGLEDPDDLIADFRAVLDTLV